MAKKKSLISAGSSSADTEPLNLVYSNSPQPSQQFRSQTTLRSISPPRSDHLRRMDEELLNQSFQLSSPTGNNSEYSKLSNSRHALSHVDTEISSEVNVIAGSNEGKSTITSAVLNFVNSIVGAGIIGLPFAIYEAGFFMGIFSICALAFLVDWTVRLLIRTANMAGRNNSYQDLVEFCFGRYGLMAVSLFQLLFAFGGMCAYLVIVGDTMPLVLRHITGNDASVLVMFITSRRFVILVTTLGIAYPLSLYRDISKLAKASAVALFALIYIILAIIIVGPMEDKSLRDPGEWDFIRPSFLQALGVTSFAFVCHHNSFLIYGSLRQPTMSRWAAVTHWSTGLSCLLSLSLAVPGYLVFGSKTHGNILNNFSTDNAAINVARLAFALNMFTTFPLESFVCREVIETYFYTGQEISNRLNWLITSALTFFALTISLSTCNLGFVLELAGGFSASALAYVIPCACYLKLLPGKKLSLKNWAPILTIIFGIVVMFLSTVLAIRNHYNSTETKDCRW